MRRSGLKFIIATDDHLDGSQHSLECFEVSPVEEIRDAIRRSFEELVEYVIDEEVAYMFRTSDIYDGDWLDYNTGFYFKERLGRLREVGIWAFIVADSHHAASQLTKHILLNYNVTMFTTRKPKLVILDDYNVAIYGLMFATRAEIADRSLVYSKTDPQLFNTCLDGKLGYETPIPLTRLMDCG